MYVFHYLGEWNCWLILYACPKFLNNTYFHKWLGQFSAHEYDNLMGFLYSYLNMMLFIFLILTTWWAHSSITLLFKFAFPCRLIKLNSNFMFIDQFFLLFRLSVEFRVSLIYIYMFLNIYKIINTYILDQSTLLYTYIIGPFSHAVGCLPLCYWQSLSTFSYIACAFVSYLKRSLSFSRL